MDHLKSSLRNVAGDDPSSGVACEKCGCAVPLVRLERTKKRKVKRTKKVKEEAFTKISVTCRVCSTIVSSTTIARRERSRQVKSAATTAAKVPDVNPEPVEGKKKKKKKKKDPFAGLNLSHRKSSPAGASNTRMMKPAANSVLSSMLERQKNLDHEGSKLDAMFAE